MPMPSIRRRVQRLAQSGCFYVPRVFSSLSVSEIEDLTDRAQRGESITEEEVDRVRAQSPICCGELLMHAYGGNFGVKRYVGIDVANV
jgi:hypothetical protein